MILKKAMMGTTVNEERLNSMLRRNVFHFWLIFGIHKIFFMRETNIPACLSVCIKTTEPIGLKQIIPGLQVYGHNQKFKIQN